MNQKNRSRLIVSGIALAAAIGVIALIAGTDVASPIGKPPKPTVARTLTIGRNADRLDTSPAFLRARGRAATAQQKHLFKVFRGRPASPMSQALRDGADMVAAPAMAGSTPTEPNLSGLRPVYESATITTGILPTSQGLCFVGIVSGISSSLCTTTIAASKGGLGLLVHRGSEYDIMGVLPEGAKRVVVEGANGDRVEAPLDSEDGYAAALEAEPTAVDVTGENGVINDVTVSPTGTS